MSNIGQPAISFKNVSKRFTYSREQPQSIQETMISLLGRGQRYPKKELWALRDLSFDLYQGQSLGIVGRNGSGKSTVLKLVARIMRPTEGQVTVNGRVSALLELGAGFHPDLTGRENIALNASVLGLSEQELGRNFEAIVEFSELGEFIDMPVKHYSSGMYMRLGFSVAIHVDPDILIIDEILAVGDQEFQTKCIDRIHELHQNGVSIILISHNLNVVRRMCSQVIWLENGQMRASGPTEDVATQYRYQSDTTVSRRLMQDKETQSFNRWGSGEIEIEGVRFLDTNGEERSHFQTGEEMIVEMAYVAHEPVPKPEFGLAIFHQNGTQVNGPNSQLGGLETGIVADAGKVRYRIRQLPLLPGRYQVTAAIHNTQVTHAYDFHEKAYPFRVIAGGTKETDGLVAFAAEWSWEKDGGESSWEAK
ncbi:MAG: ABC transporter ATP-binding protein [Candidatus Promineifilaceae bacterium]